jgi:hypothetical protein
LSGLCNLLFFKKKHLFFLLLIVFFFLFLFLNDFFIYFPSCLFPHCCRCILCASHVRIAWTIQKTNGHFMVPMKVLQDLPQKSNVYCCLTCKYCNLNLKKPHMQCGWPCNTSMWITKYALVLWGLGYHFCMWGNNTHWFFGSILQYSHGSHKMSTGFLDNAMQYLSTSWVFASMVLYHFYIKILKED